MMFFVRTGLFLALAAPLASAFGQMQGDGIASNSTAIKQPPPFGVTIIPQGSYSVLPGKMATKVEVDIGNIVKDQNGNKVFAKLQGYTTRQGSLNPNNLWSAASYPGLQSKTLYTIQAKLYASGINPPAPEAEVALVQHSMTTP